MALSFNPVKLVVLTSGPKVQPLDDPRHNQENIVQLGVVVLRGSNKLSSRSQLEPGGHGLAQATYRHTSEVGFLSRGPTRLLR